MKKKLVLIAAVVLVICAVIIGFSLSASQEKKTEPDTSVDGDGTIVIKITEAQETEETPTRAIDKKTTVRFPLMLIDQQYHDDLDAYAKAKGYEKIKVVGDDVEIVMTEFSYGLLLTSVGVKTVSGICDTIESEDYPYVLSLTEYNEDFSYIVMGVDKKGYSAADNLNDLYNCIAVYALSYQLYNENSDDKCKIYIVEEGSNILLEERVLTTDIMFN